MSNAFGVVASDNVQSRAHVDAVQVSMKDRWELVDNTLCISHVNLRQEICDAFKTITGQFSSPSITPDVLMANLRHVLEGDPINVFYERPHAKMFAEFVIMQLCSSIGQTRVGRRAAESIAAAEGVLRGTPPRVSMQSTGMIRTVITPSTIGEVLNIISLLPSARLVA